MSKLIVIIALTILQVGVALAALGSNPGSAAGWLTEPGFAVHYFVKNIRFPMGVAFDQQGNFYFNAYSEGCIYRYNMPFPGSTTFYDVNVATTQRVWRKCSADWGMDSPYGIAFNGVGEMWVSFGSSRIIRLDPNTVAKIAGPFASCHWFGAKADPKDTTGRKLLVGCSNGVMTRYDPASIPTTTETLANCGGNIDDFNIDIDGNMYAALPPDRVCRIDMSVPAHPVTKITVGSYGVDGIAVSSDKKYLITNNNAAGAALTKVDLMAAGNPVKIIATNSIASRGDLATVGPDGCFYFDGDKQIFKLTTGVTKDANGNITGFTCDLGQAGTTGGETCPNCSHKTSSKICVNQSTPAGASVSAQSTGKCATLTITSDASLCV